MRKLSASHGSRGGEMNNYPAHISNREWAKQYEPTCTYPDWEGEDSKCCGAEKSLAVGDVVPAYDTHNMRGAAHIPRHRHKIKPVVHFIPSKAPLFLPNFSELHKKLQNEIHNRHPDRKGQSICSPKGAKHITHGHKKRLPDYRCFLVCVFQN